MNADRVIVEDGRDGAIQVRCPTPFIQINTARQTSLRLNDPHYVFPEAPDLRAMTGAAVQLDFLRDHLNGYCDLWRKPQKLFLDSYFEFINARVADAQATLAAALEKFGDLYDVQDWALSAPRPIPRALIRRPNGDGSYTPVDFAFWFNGCRGIRCRCVLKHPFQLLKGYFSLFQLTFFGNFWQSRRCLGRLWLPACSNCIKAINKSLVIAIWLHLVGLKFSQQVFDLIQGFEN